MANYFENPILKCSAECVVLVQVRVVKHFHVESVWAVQRQTSNGPEIISMSSDFDAALKQYEQATQKPL
jgi:hypothetical protein